MVSHAVFLSSPKRPVGPLLRRAAHSLTASPRTAVCHHPDQVVLHAQGALQRDSRRGFCPRFAPCSREIDAVASFPCPLQVKYTQQVWHEKLSKLLDEFPRVDGAQRAPGS